MKKESYAAETVLSWLPPALSAAFVRAAPHKDAWTEIRLRAYGAQSITCGREGKNLAVMQSLTPEDLWEILVHACGGSVHVYDEELRRGCLTPLDSGGIRIGLCGWCFSAEDAPMRIRRLHALAVRLPSVRTVPCEDALRILRGQHPEVSCAGTRCAGIVSTLFYGPPGCGKTTLLRSLMLDVSRTRRTAVIDTGGELLLPQEDCRGCLTDFFCGYPRGMGLELAVRAFSPEVLLCDEIGTEAEAEALLRAQTGGVPLIATAHAGSLRELLSRPAAAALRHASVFSQYIRVQAEPSGVSFAEESL